MKRPYSNIKKITILLLFLCQTISGSIEKGYKALSIYDYFKAKGLFEQLVKKQNPYASYGLALIYSRHDNPFTNMDSALKYANLGFNWYQTKPIRKNLHGYLINDTTIQNHIDNITIYQFNELKTATPDIINQFLKTHYLCSPFLMDIYVTKRDMLEFKEVQAKNSSFETSLFILTHPYYDDLEGAKRLMEKQVYEEFTPNKSSEELLHFISKNPNNSNITNAYGVLLELYRTAEDVTGIQQFLKSFPNAPQQLEAWHLLFHLSVKEHSNKEIETFLKSNPDFPFKNNLLRELELNELKLIPVEINDLFGYTDLKGKLVIPALFDDAKSFREGVAVVQRNDSVYYIDKDNQPVIPEFFNEAYPFYKGLAAVKKGTEWFLIDRLGNRKTDAYEDISEISEGKYIVKKGGLYGCIDYSGSKLLGCEFEKLGDFKNNTAYYTEKSNYGFVNISNNYRHPAEFSWISEFDKNHIAIIKKANLFGLIKDNGQVILEPELDMIYENNSLDFILVKNNAYGFFAQEKCYYNDLIYEFDKTKPSEYYSSGDYFRLIEKGKEYIVDRNGAVILSSDNYNEINFPYSGLMRVKKRDKYGYLNLEQKFQIPAQYTEAEDFIEGTAIVSDKTGYSIIDTNGKKISGSEDKPRRIGKKHFIVSLDNSYRLIDKSGKILCEGLNETEVSEDYIIVYMDNKDVKIYPL